MTDGQRLALEQLREIEAASADLFEIVSTKEPSEEAPWLLVEVAVRTGHLPRAPAGLPLRARERFLIHLPPDFPFFKPEVYVRHTRFTGRAHVQWKRYLCLYQAPDTEWDSSDGMFGFIERLWLWLKQGALDQLDPIGGPLHPPVAYVPSGPVRTVVPRANTPAVGDTPWTGLAQLKMVHEYRADVVGWSELYANNVEAPVGAAILLPEPMPFEFPQQVADLFDELEARGVSRRLLMLTMQEAVLKNPEDTPLFVLIGTPMRGVRGSDALKQHLTVWYLDPIPAKALRLAIHSFSKDEQLREFGKEVEKIFLDWAAQANVAWCSVREDRPEIVTRRDYQSPLSIFQDKTVALWGCGALGGHIALYLTRAGVGRLILRDNSIVTPGVLLRQPYDDADIGRAKVDALRDKLLRIRPDLPVESCGANILSSVLTHDDWTDGADVIIDCTASRIVRNKLELVRRTSEARTVPVVSMIISQHARHGLVVVAGVPHSGGPADVYRRAQLAACREHALKDYADAFHPQDSEADVFQPEPGCSSPTFIGSAADVAMLAGLMLNRAAVDLSEDDEAEMTTAAEHPPTAWAHFVMPSPAADIAPRANSPASYAWRPDLITHDPRRGYEVRITTQAWQEMRDWIARSKDEVGPLVETGGLLFGERDDALGIVWISSVGGPPSDSVASEDLFVCGTDGTLAAHREQARWSRGSMQYVGMWHTHPVSAPLPSPTDLAGMRKLLGSGELSPSRSLLMIIGTPHDHPTIGTFIFDRSDVRSYRGETYTTIRLAQVESSPQPGRSIGLALSGGGSRAIAFHLGCLRALHDRGILRQVDIISAVSGGAVIAAMYAYSDDDFHAFERRALALLRSGLQLDIARQVFLSPTLIGSIGTGLSAGLVAKGAQLLRGALLLGHGLIGQNSRSVSPAWMQQIRPPLPRWVSRSTAFEDVLRKRLFRHIPLTAPRRDGLSVILNATELRTGTAFRFGSESSACWRFGRVAGNAVDVASAVAASAAYPAFLPAIHRRYTFETANGETCLERVVLTDGGVYDNLGVTCLEPGRSMDYAAHVYACDHIICCNAGHGQWDGQVFPYGWMSRMKRSMEATFRRAQDETKTRLFGYRESGALKGLIIPYLGQQDRALMRDLGEEALPEDFVERREVISYPTDFRAMPEVDIEKITRRGEQLTHLLAEAYWPD